jgi:hypothetical protein
VRKAIYKWFWLWSFDKEEKWLNEMAAKGLVLVGVGFTRYEFEECAPGEYNIRLEMLKDSVSHIESQRYIRFLEDTGVEHIGTLLRWVYFRKKADITPFDLFSDIDSRIRHLNRLLFIPGILGIVNLFNAINMTKQYLLSDTDFALVPAMLTWAVTLLMTYGFLRLYSKKQKLKK